MQSVIDNPQDDFKELHEKRIKEFLSNYELSA
jgi:D-serine dehydratase